MTNEWIFRGATYAAHLPAFHSATTHSQQADMDSNQQQFALLTSHPETDVLLGTIKLWPVFIPSTVCFLCISSSFLGLGTVTIPALASRILYLYGIAVFWQPGLGAMMLPRFTGYLL